jgi:hypothetical protein
MLIWRLTGRLASRFTGILRCRLTGQGPRQAHVQAAT